MATKKKTKSRKALGRGLSALISSSAPVSESPVELKLAKGRQDIEETEQLVSYLSPKQLTPNPNQPRKNFDKQELEDLVSSIKTHGLIQPILVRPTADEKYQIIAGERRWRAASMAKVKYIPVIIKEIDDLATLELALIENIQRSNLSVLELARAYQFLIEEHGLSQQQLAQRVGKDRSSVANVLRLLKLPEKLQGYLAKGKISFGHAKAILTVKEPAAQINLAEKCINEKLSVRALEAIVGRVVVLPTNKTRKSKAKTRKSSQFTEVEDRLRKSLGTKVSIQQGPKNKGQIEIQYFSEQELERLVDIICGTI